MQTKLKTFSDSFLRKKSSFFSPIHILFAAVVVAVLLGLFVIHVATERPWLGLSLSYDKSAEGVRVRSSKGPSAHIPRGTVFTEISSDADRLILSELDFVAEPDGGMGTYKVYEEFLSRQDRLAKFKMQKKSYSKISKEKPGRSIQKANDRFPAYQLNFGFNLL